MSGRFAAIRECLQKHGITLPQRKPGQRPSPGSGQPGSGVGLKLPPGMTRAQFAATTKKCGFNPQARGLAGGARLNSPAVKQALAKFATCMHEHGVNMPAPNTSGTGPVFSAKGLNTKSAQFQAAEAKCRGDLRASFRASPGAGGSPPKAP